MKRLLTYLLLLFCSLTAMGEEMTTVTFQGTVSAVTVNGKHFQNIQNQVFVLKKQSATKGTITGDIGKIGKMPGTLHFDIPVTIKADGTLVTARGSKVGVMHFPLGMTKKLVSTSMTGTCSNTTLSFSLGVKSTMLGIKVADASFSFQSR